jgi:hypothetical protein
MLPVYGIMNPSMRLKSARPPGSGRKRAHCRRMVDAGEPGLDMPDATRAGNRRQAREAATNVRWPLLASTTLARCAQTLGGIVNVTVVPGWIDNELLIGAAFDPIGSMRKRTVFAGLMM